MSRDFDRDLAALRDRLACLGMRTAEAVKLAPPGGFVGDASWRRALDDYAAGRVDFKAAHFAAAHGLEACVAAEAAREALIACAGEDADRLDAEAWDRLELAEAWAAQASGLYTAALEKAAGPKGLAGLCKSAAPRGRKVSEDIAKRNRRLAAAVERLRAADPTLTGKAARSKALDDDPSLADAFCGHSEDALRQALRRKNCDRN